jgi:hypothetical protein
MSLSLRLVHGSWTLQIVKRSTATSASLDAQSAALGYDPIKCRQGQMSTCLRGGLS